MCDANWKASVRLKSRGHEDMVCLGDSGLTIITRHFRENEAVTEYAFTITIDDLGPLAAWMWKLTKDWQAANLDITEGEE